MNGHKIYCDYEIKNAKKQTIADFRGRQVLKKSPSGMVRNEYSNEELEKLLRKCLTR